MIKLKNIIWESMDSWNPKDVYGHWISPTGKGVDVHKSHELTAVEILKELLRQGKITKDEYYGLNIPLNSTSEVEDILFKYGWIRGVTDGKADYWVNGRNRQPVTPEQIRWMKKHGEETKRSVYWCPAGEGEQFGVKTIYDPSDIMESKEPNPRLGLCYELSGRYVSGHPDAVLVHGRLTNPFAAGHPELDHAWVEEGNEILDPVMDKRWPKEAYEGLFKVKVYKKYTFREVIQIINKHEHWGPWDEVVSEGDRDSGRGKSLPQTGYAYKHVEIFRAMHSKESGLKPNDFVTRSKKFAIEHSDHMTSVNEELYHVMRFVVKAEHVFEAWNPGEYFYNGPDVKGTEVYNSKKFL